MPHVESQHGRAQQQIAHVRRPALEDLGQQAGRHRALAAAEFLDAAFGVGGAGPVR
jgi:hypothetical protein